MEALLIRFDGSVKFTTVPYRATRNSGGPETVLRFPVRVGNPRLFTATPLDMTAPVEMKVEEFELLTITHNTNIAIYEQRY